MKYFYNEISNNYKKVFFYLISILFINAAIYAHPINFSLGIQQFYNELTIFDFNSKLNILAYFVFIINFFYYAQSRFSLKTKNSINNILIILFLVFFTQAVGTLNLRLNFTDSLYLSQFSFFYLLNISTVILLITNIVNEKNHYLIKTASIFQFLILLIIVLIICYKANPFIHGYGKYLLKFSFFNDPNKTLYVNSNGLGRLTAIFCLIFYNFLLYTKSNTTKFLLLILSTTFLILTLVTEGRLNFLLVHMGLILSTIFHKSNNKKYLFFLILIIISQIFYKINLDKKINNINTDSHRRDSVKYNIQRVYSNLNNSNP
ncbi:hypothetical protein OAJ75_05210, partial [Candidatus Pelagibacter sp.]|nr:hypothetical protein [Candidatus Pelagibacter sp.]